MGGGRETYVTPDGTERQRGAYRDVARSHKGVRAVAPFVPLPHFVPAAHKVFRLVDRDDDGRITRAELIRAIEADQRVKNHIIARPHMHVLLQPHTFRDAWERSDVDRR